MSSGIHEFLAQDRVIWGRPVAQAVPEEADRRGARRVFIVTSKTLNRKTDAVEKIRQALGPRCAGTFDECREYTPRPSVIAAAAARAAAENLWVRTNPRPIKDTSDLVRLLESAW